MEISNQEVHDDGETSHSNSKRKTPLQLQTLQNLFSEDKYPTQRVMEDYAAALGLTYKQVKGWFVERRRREKNQRTEKNKNGSSLDRTICKSAIASKTILKKGVHSGNRGSKMTKKILSSSKHNLLSRKRQRCSCNHGFLVDRTKKPPLVLQDLLHTSDYILKKVFRKDGPPLGVEFDAFPSRPFCHCTAANSSRSHPTNQEKHRATKRRKVIKPADLEPQASSKSSNSVKKHGKGKGLMTVRSNTEKKHGMGKGLMTVWRAMHPNSGPFPTGLSVISKEATVKRPKKSVSLKVQRRQVNKQDKRQLSTKRRKVELKRDENQRKPNKVKCELALGVRSEVLHIDQYKLLADDEELELRELQAGSNPLTCSAHFNRSGLHGCSLCKDMLAKFPPNAVKLKKLFCKQPWDSSAELVKKLFKAIHFLYTYAVTLDICSFTLDEFAQAFHEKDSMLLGNVHVALLKVLLSDVEKELSGGGFVPRMSKYCMFLGLLQSVEHQEYVLEFWRKSLNSLTWPEILRQVLVAAGFGSKEGPLRRVANKEVNHMVKYGLQPNTLKGELFKILSEGGANGLKVSELAISLQIVELNLASTTDELELLISSTLSSDVTLFEKISPSSYRLRLPSMRKEAAEVQSDSEDSGSVEDDAKDSDAYSSSDDNVCDSVLDLVDPNKLVQRNIRKMKNKVLALCTEIDESHPGEAWLLGLMEGEYSHLSISEKLSSLVALVDLLNSGSSIRKENPKKALAESISSNHHGSGAKIKRKSASQLNSVEQSWSPIKEMDGTESEKSSESPIDSLTILSSGVQFGRGSHPMQSVFLGSDRRYNRYWLFLGPCDAEDPGHKRVYFESSEDGHWECIDTEEALCVLLSVLDGRGTREARLLASLKNREAFLCQAMAPNVPIGQRTESNQPEIDMVREDSSSPVSDVDHLSQTDTGKDPVPRGAIVFETGNKAEDQKQRWSRLQKFDAWIWDSFYYSLHAVRYGKRSYIDSLARCASCHDLYWRDEKHCKICHTTFELDFDLEEKYAIHAAMCREKDEIDMFPKYKILPSQLQSLKAAIHAVESAIPEGALVGAWKKSAHKLWVKRLRRTSSMVELLQVLADFVGAIKEDWLCESNFHEGSNTILEEIITCFPTMPQTSSAVALWLVKLDSLIAPHLERACSKEREESRGRSRSTPILCNSSIFR